MSDVRLTKKQVLFLIEWLEIEDPQKAADRFIEILSEQKADPIDIALYIDRIIKVVEKKKK